MKLSVFYDHILQAQEQSGKPLSELFGLCRSFGIEAVELSYARFAAERESVWDGLLGAGLSVSCLYEFFDFTGGGGLSGAKELLETAARLHVPRVLLVPGALSAGEAAELMACGGSYKATSCFMEGNAKIQNIKQALTALTAYAAPLGVTVTLEDFDGFMQPFARMNQLLWFMNNVPGLRCTLDMGNFAFSNEDVVQAAELLRSAIVHVHCKDRAINPSVSGAFCKGLGQSPAGRGYIPIRELISWLSGTGYDGYLAIEHFDLPDQLGGIRESARFLRECAGI